MKRRWFCTVAAGLLTTFSPSRSSLELIRRTRSRSKTEPLQTASTPTSVSASRCQYPLDGKSMTPSPPAVRPGIVQMEVWSCSFYTSKGSFPAESFSAPGIRPIIPATPRILFRMRYGRKPTPPRKSANWFDIHLPSITGAGIFFGQTIRR